MTWLCQHRPSPQLQPLVIHSSQPPSWKMIWMQTYVLTTVSGNSTPFSLVVTLIMRRSISLSTKENKSVLKLKFEEKNQGGSIRPSWHLAIFQKKDGFACDREPSNVEGCLGPGHSQKKGSKQFPSMQQAACFGSGASAISCTVLQHQWVKHSCQAA